MEGNPEGAAAGDRVGPAVETDPDHPDYLGPSLIPLGEIVLFARPDCTSAERVREILRARGLGWREVDTSDPASVRRTEQLVYTGYLRTPILCACGYAVVGFDEPQILDVLDAHEQRLRRTGSRVGAGSRMGSDPVADSAICGKGRGLVP